MGAIPPIVGRLSNKQIEDLADATNTEDEALIALGLQQCKKSKALEEALENWQG
jgi:hypothetical protein